jgi:hypothetical protein
MITAKCPYCKAIPQSLVLEALPVAQTFGEAAYPGVTYSCPNCHQILGAGIDPVFLSNQILARLGKNEER